MTSLEICVSSIDFSAPGYDRFIVTYPREWFRVRNSLESLGYMVQPPLMVPCKEKGQYRIICGFRRVRAAMDLGWKTVETRIIDNQGLSDRDLLLYSIHDNAFGRGFNPVEISIALNRFFSFGGHMDDEEIDRLCGFLGIPDSRDVVDQYRELEDLPEQIKLAMAVGTITFQQGRLFLQLESGERTPLFNLVNYLKLNTNEMRELIEGFQQISRRSTRAITEIMNSEGFSDIAEADDLSRREKTVQILILMKNLRNPQLRKWEREFLETRKRLRLPSWTQVQPSAYFEGNWLDMRAKLRSITDLEELLEKLSDEKNRELMKILFKFVDGSYNITH